MANISDAVGSMELYVSDTAERRAAITIFNGLTRIMGSFYYATQFFETLNGGDCGNIYIKDFDERYPEVFREDHKAMAPLLIATLGTRSTIQFGADFAGMGRWSYTENVRYLMHWVEDAEEDSPEIRELVSLVNYPRP